MNRIQHLILALAATSTPCLPAAAAELIGAVTLSAPAPEGVVETARGPVALDALREATPERPIFETRDGLAVGVATGWLLRDDAGDLHLALPVDQLLRLDGQLTVGIGITNDHRGVEQVAIGVTNDHRGVDPVAIGVTNDHRGIDAVAIGITNDHLGIDAVAIGITNDHRGIDAVAIGVTNDHRALDLAFLPLRGEAGLTDVDGVGLVITVR